jgi:hypothetical protein
MIIKKIKKKIYQYLIQISLILINFSIKINSHKLCAFLIWLNIKKLKTISTKLKNQKKILVFPKSNGTEDLVESFCNKKSSINFFLLPRSFLKKIFSYYFDKKFQRDYFTKITKPEDIFKKNLYINFLTSVFKSLSYLIKFDGFISFNIFYYAEKHFEIVSKNLNSKYIILHKESAFNPSEEKIAPFLYKNNNDKSLCHKVSVYSDSQKKILMQSKILKKEKIEVIGTPRSDYSFKLRSVKPSKKIIVFYLIEYNRTSTVLLNNKKKDWKKLYKQTLEYVLEFAKKNPNIKIILKGKTGVHNSEQFNKLNLPLNCNFVEGGAGHTLLKNASVVIAFNSTIVFETIASNRNLIIPNFNNEDKLEKKILLNVRNKSYLANSKIQFFAKLKFYLSRDYQNKKLSNIDLKTLEYYLGNTNSNAGAKMKKFIEEEIK